MRPTPPPSTRVPHLVTALGGLLAGAVLLAGPAAVPAPAATGTTTGATTGAPLTRARLDAAARSLVRDGAPGVVIRVRDERGVRTAVAGTGDRRTGAAPDPGGEFRIGSVTKTFTATVVLALVAEGRVRLDAPVGRYLPGLLPYRAPITVRQLLAHRSGLPDTTPLAWPDLATVVRDRDRHRTPRELVALATRGPLEFRPGRRFGYSNTDDTVLGLLVERVTGHPYAYELATRVLAPAGLTGSYLPGADPRLPHRLARGYESGGVDLTRYEMSAAWASGDLVSTTRDLDRFHAALLGGRLLPDRLLRAMEASRPAFPGVGYGLGLGRLEGCGRPAYGHLGGVPGFATSTFTAPAHARATARHVTVVVNRGLTVPDRVTAAVDRLVRAELCGTS